MELDSPWNALNLIFWVKEDQTKASDEYAKRK